MMIQELSTTEINYLIDEFIHSERDRRIARRRFLDGLTIERIAEEFDLSSRHTNEIIRKIKSRLNSVKAH
jgi:DNA-directed RNA polymerase specialized sigma subunit